MWINCKIISRNYFIQHKIRKFIRRTYFMTLDENCRDEHQIIFWDYDSVTIDETYLNTRMDKGSLVFIISSIISENKITDFFQEKDISKIGYMSKNIPYNDFENEISRVIDNLNFQQIK